LKAVYGAGSYTIRVTPVDVVDASNPFTVQVSASADQAEKEPNDTFSQATVWNMNEAISGRLFSTADTDFYQFTLDQPKIVDMVFSCPYSSKNFTITIYQDPAQGEINGITIVGGATTTLPLSLQAGTYFLKVGGDGTNTDTLHAYTLAFTHSTQTSLETEPNNTIPFASSLENDVVKRGRIFNTQDKDTYGFFLPEEALFTVSFTPTTTTGDYKVSILNVQGDVLDSFTSTDGEAKNIEVYQVSGNFYVLVEANGQIDQFNPYEIKVSSTAVITAPRSYSIATEAGAGGNISPSGNVNILYSAGQSFTITPNAHYHVADVLVDEKSVGAVTSYAFTNVTSAHTISATFAIDTNVLTVTKSGTGLGIVTAFPGLLNWHLSTGTGSYDYGTVVSLSAAPDVHSIFTGWSGDECSGTAAFTVAMNSAKSIGAGFRAARKEGIDDSLKVDLTDAVLAMQIISGVIFPEAVYPQADVNEDQKVGLPEVIYILQKVAEV
jgi:hypothetical protein